MMDFVYAALERAGRGKRPDISVAFEFDSDENVTANFEGDYFLRFCKGLRVGKGGGAGTAGQLATLDCRGYGQPARPITS